MVSVQFCNNFAGPPFCCGWTKKLHFFWERPSKYCIDEFTAIFVCLSLGWTRWYSMKLSSNFGGRNFNNSTSRPLYLNFSNMMKLCPNIWFIQNSKCPQFIFWKKIAKETQIFHFFNDSRREKLYFIQFSTKMAAWLLLTFFIFLHNQLSSIHSIKYRCLKNVIHQIHSKNE